MTARRKAAPGAAAPSGALALTDKLTAYSKASAAQRSAVVPLILEVAKDDIDTKGKSNVDVAADILPCMNSTVDDLPEADRAARTIVELGGGCLDQKCYSKK
jgi:hypothetical protein